MCDPQSEIPSIPCGVPERASWVSGSEAVAVLCHCPSISPAGRRRALGPAARPISRGNPSHSARPAMAKIARPLLSAALRSGPIARPASGKAGARSLMDAISRMTRLAKPLAGRLEKHCSAPCVRRHRFSTRHGASDWASLPCRGGRLFHLRTRRPSSSSSGGPERKLTTRS